MNVVGSSHRPLAGHKKDIKEEYVSKIQLYDEAPIVELSLDQFEEYALRRLKVLRKLERTSAMRSSHVGDTKAKAALDALIKEELKDPQVDQISHFILRAAYSLDDEKRRWFLNHETMLFRHRLERVSHKELTKSVCSLFQLIPLSAKEQREKSGWLQMLQPTGVADSTFYKVPFTQALDLVAKRQCLVEGGFAYIPSIKVISILAGKFRMQLSAALAMLAQHGIFKESDHLSDDPEAERLHPLLKNMNSCLLENEPAEDGVSALQSSQMTSANVPKLVKHMPLCMQTMQAGLKKDKKLRYWGRLQYGLFLKGAGMSMEDSMLFFQRAFSNMTSEAFHKEFAYNIRHQYGKEGHRKSKTGYSCAGIINSQAPSHPGDHHGCPYKNYDADGLSRLLQTLQIGTPADRTEIVNLKKANHFQLACLTHFNATHPKAMSMDISLDNVGNHPNAWFRASMAYSEEFHSQQEGEGSGAPSQELASQT